MAEALCGLMNDCPILPAIFVGRKRADDGAGRPGTAGAEMHLAGRLIDAASNLTHWSALEQGQRQPRPRRP